MLTSTDYREMADRSAQLAIASPAPSVAEALLALALHYMTQAATPYQYEPAAILKSFAGIRRLAAGGYIRRARRERSFHASYILMSMSRLFPRSS